MANSSYPSRITHVQKSDPVSAGVASSAPRTLEARTNYLRAVLDSIEAGKALVLRDVAVKSDVEEGMPVFWNATTQQYEKALAAVENDLTLGTLVATETSDVTGMVLTKKVGNTADVALWGLVPFQDLSNVIDDTPIEPGRYYLSATESGKLVKQRPAVTVSVCLVIGPLDSCDENTYVYVMPQMRDFLEDHIHLQYNLAALPAGEHTPPLAGAPHVIVNPDSAQQGWLPASDAVFNGKAPTGAVFGYNLAMHPELDRNWPPVPVTASVLEMLRPSIYPDVKGPHQDAILDFPNTLANAVSDLTVVFPGAVVEDIVVVTADGGPYDDGILQAWVSAVDEVTVRYANATAVPLNPPSQNYHLQLLKSNEADAVSVSFKGLERVCSAYLTMDTYGIWWMTDCYNEVPWPTDYDNTASSSSSSVSSVSDSSSSSQSEATVCPTVQPMQLILSFIKMTFATNKTVVTSLQPVTGQPLEYVNCDGEVATTGDLYSKLVLAWLLEDEYYGGQVLTGITTDNKFKRGWTAEGLIAGSTKVTLTSEHQRRATPGDTSTSLVHQGLVTVDVNVDPTERELLPQISVLGDAMERVYKNIPYIGLPDGRDSGVRLKFVIPPEGLPDIPKLLIRVVIFGRSTGTMTDLDTSYYRFARPTTGVPTPVAEGDTTLALVTNIAVNSDEAHEIESEQITIAPGDTLYVSLDRLVAGTPAYSGEIGLIRVGGIIVAGS